MNFMNLPSSLSSALMTPLGKFKELRPRNARLEKVLVCAELFFTPG